LVCVCVVYFCDFPDDCVAGTLTFAGATCTVGQAITASLTLNSGGLVLDVTAVTDSCCTTDSCNDGSEFLIFVEGFRLGKTHRLFDVSPTYYP